jgi:hypothetical protein
MEEMTVTTHVIEKGPVNQVAAMIAQQAKALGAATGTKTDTPTPPNRDPKRKRGAK